MSEHAREILRLVSDDSPFKGLREAKPPDRATLDVKLALVRSPLWRGQCSVPPVANPKQLAPDLRHDELENVTSTLASPRNTGTLPAFAESWPTR